LDVFQPTRLAKWRLPSKAGFVTLDLNRRQILIFDESYLQALRDREPDAEDYLIAHFSRPVRLKLQARLRSPELIQDACQETFLRVLAYFRAGKALDNPASLPGFVHSVCHNIALEFLRGHTRHDQILENLQDPPDPSLNPEGQFVTQERTEFVRRLLGELPEKDRQLLRRVFLEEEDKDLVCSELHVDRGYLRVLLHRARLRFKAAVLRADAAGASSGSGKRNDQHPKLTDETRH
jgi:RNA polymerase sigma-70 factor (ECF subfamily)